MSNANDFVDGLGLWPSDYSRQLEWVNRFKLKLQQANDFIVDSIGLVVTLYQATEPTQLEWETAWTAQTGLPTPIPATADLLWFNTSENAFGGIYGTVIGSTIVYARTNRYPRGGAIYVNSGYKTDRINPLTHNIGAQLSNYPALTFTLPVVSDIVMEFSLYVKLNSGTGQWGADFLINGVKAGTQYMGIPTNQGIFNGHTHGQIAAKFTLSNAPAGTYTIQSIFGVTNNPVSPPNLIIGGVSGADSYGARVLLVKAYAK